MMTEAQAIGILVLALTAIVSLVGGIIALIRPLVQPITKSIKDLTKSMVALNVTVSELKDDFSEVKSDIERNSEKNRDARRRIWEHNNEQDKKLDEHDKRILRLEIKEKGGK